MKVIGHEHEFMNEKQTVVTIGEHYIQEQEQFREFLEAETAKSERAFVGDFLAKWPL